MPNPIEKMKLKIEKMKLKIELYFAKRKMNREHFKLVDSPDYGGRTHYDADEIKYIMARRKYESLQKRLESFDDKNSTPDSKDSEKKDNLRDRVKSNVGPVDTSNFKKTTNRDESTHERFD